MLEAELFGHEKGAFTGAHIQRTGRFEMANDGTLLMDEIGELSLGLQVKLLRLLQEQRIERIGGREEILINVRVLAATNKNLTEETGGGRVPGGSLLSPQRRWDPSPGALGSKRRCSSLGECPSAKVRRCASQEYHWFQPTSDQCPHETLTVGQCP